MIIYITYQLYIIYINKYNIYLYVIKNTSLYALHIDNNIAFIDIYYI